MGQRKFQVEGIADYYGFERQSRQATEECGELIQAVNKLVRAYTEEQIPMCVVRELPKEKQPREECESVSEEIADVQIMLWQLERQLNCRDEVEVNIDTKVRRQVDRIDREQQERGVITTIKDEIAVAASFAEQYCDTVRTEGD